MVIVFCCWESTNCSIRTPPSRGVLTPTETQDLSAQVLTIALCTVTNSISNILSLMANAMMDSSIQYPIFNAAQICLAALLSALVLKEKPNTATIIQTGVCVVGILTLLL